MANRRSQVIAAASLLAVFIFPLVASAQVATTQTADPTQLQGLIQILLADVQTLQQELAIAQGSSVQWCHAFYENLRAGDSGLETSFLQTAMNEEGIKIATSGTFDSDTTAAVIVFQDKYPADILTPNNLKSGTGYAGLSTRAKLNSLYGCGTAIALATSTPSSATPLPSPTPSPTPVTPTPAPAPSSTPASYSTPYTYPTPATAAPSPAAGPVSTYQGQTSFSSSAPTVKSGSSMNFYWSNAVNATFGATNCSSVTMSDAQSGQSFPCGSSRSVPVSGFASIRFTGSGQVQFTLQYIGGSISRTVTVN